MISIGYAGGFSLKERSKLDLVVNLANRVLGSLEFKEAVLAHEVKDGKLVYKGFHDTVDTNLVVYKKIIAANAPVVVYLQTPPWYKRWFTSELARENSDGSITINRDYFNRVNNLPALTGTLIHELAHRADYSHSYNRTYLRDFSAPYGLGIIAEKLANGLTLTPIVAPEDPKPECKKVPEPA